MLAEWDAQMWAAALVTLQATYPNQLIGDKPVLPASAAATSPSGPEVVDPTTSTPTPPDTLSTPDPSPLDELDESSTRLVNAADDPSFDLGALLDLAELEKEFGFGPLG